MRNNYAASGLKGIRVAVGMYNRRNENLETGEITCRMFADRNSEPERFENENTVILYNSIRQVEAPSMQDIVPSSTQSRCRRSPNSNWMQAA